MGRGRSNYTKLSWAVDSYIQDWNERHPDRPWSGVFGAFRRQLKGSRWFRKHFVETTVDGPNELDRFISAALNKNSNLIQVWFSLAKTWPLKDMTIIKIGGHSKGHPTSNRYRYLNYHGINLHDEETIYRQRAQFFLILVQHFLGRAEAKKLLSYYQEHQVKYRKIRTDTGIKLQGEDLIEFRMRLGGHSLLIPPIKDEYTEGQEKGDL